MIFLLIFFSLALSQPNWLSSACSSCRHLFKSSLFAGMDKNLLSNYCSYNFFSKINIIDYSLAEEISVDVYESEWIDVDERLKKDLQLIMLRSQKPTFLTAWKFSKVSLHSYGVILSTASSYFAFMRSFYDTSK